MELKDTIELMNSKDYKERFIAEYLQIKIRYNKLLIMLMKWDKGELNFNPSVPRFAYDKQIEAMNYYMNVLEYRAEIEKIDLSKYEIKRG